MDFSRLKRTEVVGMLSGALLAVSLFLPWYSLSRSPDRVVQQAWVCGAGNYSCSAWQTFPINRWLFLAAAVAPFILTYFVLSAQRGQYPTGEFTMTVGLAVIVLVAFNGVIAKPGSDFQFGLSLDYGFYVALLAGFVMAGAGAMVSLESGGGAQRKPPATF
ncbi:MAG: hypothetical protein U0R52_09395 [Solirubrobacterales bacterium]